MRTIEKASSESKGKYTIGSFVGEEWIYYKKYTVREETCVALGDACLLEFTVESFEAIREILIENSLAKDVSMLETQLKRSYLKKARVLRD